MQTEKKILCGCGHDSDCHFAVGVWIGKGRVCAHKGCKCVRYEPDRDALRRIEAKQKGSHD